MNKLFFVILIVMGSVVAAQAQRKEVEKDCWTSFTQAIDVSHIKQKTKFRVSAYVKVEGNDQYTLAGVWARVDTAKTGSSFFDNMDDRPIRSRRWRRYMVEGEMDDRADKVYFGGLCKYGGKFYFDKFEFQLQNKKGEFETIPIKNHDFEETVSNNTIPGWMEGIRADLQVRVLTYDYASTDDAVEGNKALMIDGTRAEADLTYLIGPIDGYTPQIGAMVSMLTNVTNELEYLVKNLSQEEIDWLFDEKANSIGAIIMYLIAVEDAYQLYTFENRRRTAEEREKWSAAMKLGDEGREKFKGKPISYYLEQYREVRAKTLAELKKRDDEWFKQALRPDALHNNHYCWFAMTGLISNYIGQ
ncbi:MAG: hypothetical protein ACPGJS_18965, partial [Flammeovirgaceae bacterium]